MHLLKLNLLAAILIVMLLFLQYKLWVKEDGVRGVMALKKTLALQAIENDKLKKQNDALLFQVQRLKHSQDATESRARSELGMIKKGETFYQMVK